MNRMNDLVLLNSLFKYDEKYIKTYLNNTMVN